MSRAYSPPSDPPVPSTGPDGAGRVSDLFPLGDWIRHRGLRSFPVLWWEQ